MTNLEFVQGISKEVFLVIPPPIAAAIIGLLGTYYIVKYISSTWNKRQLHYNMKKDFVAAFVKWLIGYRNCANVLYRWTTQDIRHMNIEFPRKPWGEHKIAVQRLAYKKWEDSDKPHDRSEEFWLEAEQELFGEDKSDQEGWDVFALKCSKSPKPIKVMDAYTHSWQKALEGKISFPKMKMPDGNRQLLDKCKDTLLEYEIECASLSWFLRANFPEHAKEIVALTQGMNDARQMVGNEIFIEKIDDQIQESIEFVNKLAVCF